MYRVHDSGNPERHKDRKAARSRLTRTKVHKDCLSSHRLRSSLSKFLCLIFQSQPAPSVHHLRRIHFGEAAECDRGRYKAHAHPRDALADQHYSTVVSWSPFVLGSTASGHSSLLRAAPRLVQFCGSVNRKDLTMQQGEKRPKRQKRWGPTRNRTGDLCQLRIRTPPEGADNTLRQHNKPLYDWPLDGIRRRLVAYTMT